MSQATHAASQGSIASNSGGTADVTLVLGLNARITGFDDFLFGTWDGSSTLSADDNICVGQSGTGIFGTGSYRILAQGDGDSGDPSAFTLANGSGHQVYYDAYFNDQGNPTGRTQLTPGLQLSGQTAFGIGLIFNLILGGCPIPNANLSIEVPPANLSAAYGAYSGTLRVTLIPE
ncbi:MAG: hypothetical protein AAF513_15275 [Pseudomonadota bacterium]